MALPSGYQLDHYRIEAELGHGGFGITYRAVDTRLDRLVAIKEYLPRDLAFRSSGQTVQAISQADHEMFEWGLERFLDEARTLAKFNHPNIVRVLQFFRANDTAYLVMEFCEGEPLDRKLQSLTRLPPETVQKLFDTLLDGLNELHKTDVIHRDIKPANIYLRSDGSPVLLDFGSARQAVIGHSRSMTSVLSPHYAAIEQYSSTGKQGPWTDLYGLAATLYHCITGERPPEATDRIEDNIIPTTKAGASFGHNQALLIAIDWTLSLKPADRPQSANELKAMLLENNSTRETIYDPTKHHDKGSNLLSTNKNKNLKKTTLLSLGVSAILVGLATYFHSYHYSGSDGYRINDRFYYHGDGTVTDEFTGLVWMRCSVGQRWSGQTCVGTANKYDWRSATELSSSRVGEYGYWRLPTRDELRTLVYCSSGRNKAFTNNLSHPMPTDPRAALFLPRSHYMETLDGRCLGGYFQPTIDEQVFPATPTTSPFWTSTHHEDQTGMAWRVAFNDGRANWSFMAFDNHVRLVRKPDR